MESYLGTILPWSLDFAPRGWALCNGALLTVNNNQALFSLLGSCYGGNGQTTFALPDMRGRFVLGAGPNTALADVAQEKLSTATGTAVLNVNHLPAHTHPAVLALTAMTAETTVNVGVSQTGAQLVAQKDSVLSASPSGTQTTAAIYQPASAPPGGTVNLGGVSTEITGTGTLSIGPNVTTNAPITVASTFKVTPPYLALNFIICTSGIFPTRN